eukprot:jgi/Mesvir1/11773/Mv00140-RA.1
MEATITSLEAEMNERWISFLRTDPAFRSSQLGVVTGNVWAMAQPSSLHFAPCLAKGQVHPILPHTRAWEAQLFSLTYDKGMARAPAPGLGSWQREDPQSPRVSMSGSQTLHCARCHAVLMHDDDVIARQQGILCSKVVQNVDLGGSPANKGITSGAYYNPTDQAQVINVHCKGSPDAPCGALLGRYVPSLQVYRICQVWTGLDLASAPTKAMQEEEAGNEWLEFLRGKDGALAKWRDSPLMAARLAASNNTGGGGGGSRPTSPKVAGTTTHTGGSRVGDAGGESSSGLRGRETFFPKVGMDGVLRLPRSEWNRRALARCHGQQVTYWKREGVSVTGAGYPGGMAGKDGEGILVGMAQGLGTGTGMDPALVSSPRAQAIQSPRADLARPQSPGGMLLMQSRGGGTVPLSPLSPALGQQGPESPFGRAGQHGPLAAMDSPTHFTSRPLPDLLEKPLADWLDKLGMGPAQAGDGLGTAGTAGGDGGQLSGQFSLDETSGTGRGGANDPDARAASSRRLQHTVADKFGAGVKPLPCVEQWRTKRVFEHGS